MRTVRRILPVLAAFAVAIIPATAHGQCIQFEKPEESFAASEAVFVGTVVAHEPTGVQGFHVIVDIATFRLETSWKGNLNREVRIGADRLFDVGKKYVVFASGKPLSTSIACQWAELIDKAKVKLDWLSTRSSQPIG
jgi:hypothetical protein